VTWLDDAHDWRNVSRGKLTLHWYSGSTGFAEELVSSAADSLDRLAETTGVASQSPIDLYIYETAADMRAAVLYQPGWTGGLAFSEHDIVTIGISPDQLEWGKRTAAHELTHVLVGHQTFSCLGSVPTWLNEGIAVYGEGGPDQASLRAFANALAADKLFSVRALSGGFSEDPARADLSYSESYSLVAFLVNQFGQAKLNQLFGDLRQGVTIDDALRHIYGFGLDGLEDRWRAALGAPAVRRADTTPTATTPTSVAMGAAATIAPAVATPLPVAPADAQTAAPGNNTLIAIVVVMLLAVAAVVAVRLIRTRSSS
jgi:hypothetical protein